MTGSRATVVSISSLVAAGPVGNSVIVPALLALGTEPMQPAAPLVQKAVGRLQTAMKGIGVESGDMLRATCFVTSLEDAAQGRATMQAAFPSAALTSGLKSPTFRA